MKNQQAETAYKKLTKPEKELARTVDRLFSQFDEDISGSFSLKEFQKFIRTVPQAIKYFSASQKYINSQENSKFIEQKMKQLYKIIKIGGRQLFITPRQKYLQQFENKFMTIQQMEKEYTLAEDKDKQIDKLEMYCFFKYALSGSIIDEAINSLLNDDKQKINSQMVKKQSFGQVSYNSLDCFQNQ